MRQHSKGITFHPNHALPQKPTRRQLRKWLASKSARMSRLNFKPVPPKAICAYIASLLLTSGTMTFTIVKIPWICTRLAGPQTCQPGSYFGTLTDCIAHANTTMGIHIGLAYAIASLVMVSLLSALLHAFVHEYGKMRTRGTNLRTVLETEKMLDVSTYLPLMLGFVLCIVEMCV